MKAIVVAEVVFEKGVERFYRDSLTLEQKDGNIFSRERKEMYKKEGFKGTLSLSYEKADIYKFAAFVEADSENKINAYAKKMKIGGIVCPEKLEVCYKRNLKDLKELGFDIDKLPTINL